MKVFKGQLLVLLLIFIRNSTCVIDSLYDTGKVMWKLYQMIDSIKLNNSEDAKEIDEIFRGEDTMNYGIKDQINLMHEQLHEMDRTTTPKKIPNLFIFTSSEIMIHKAVDKFELFIQNIDETYNEFYEFLHDSSYVSRDISPNLIPETILNIEGDIEVIRSLMIDAKNILMTHKNLELALTGRSTVRFHEICGVPEIVANLIIRLFKMTMIAELKANLILAVGNVYRHMRNDGWKVINSYARKGFEEIFGVYVNEFALAVDMSDALFVRACDPDGPWIRGENFCEMEGAFQVTIFRHHWAKCKHNSCNDVWYNKAYQCDPNIYDIRSSCLSAISECVYLSATEICVLKNGPYRFQYANSSALGLLGRNTECPIDKGYIIEDGRGWRFNFATCACNCYSNHNKISLSILRSRVDRNMIITGLRFIRSDDVLYIQPREGKLNSNGYIPRDGGRWVPLKTPQEYSRIDKRNRIFFLDDVRLPPYYALTGVKFNKVTRGNVTGFAIQIFGTPFDYKTGKLQAHEKFELSKQVTNEDPGKALLFVERSPIHERFENYPSSSEFKYIQLERSKLQYDFGQSTLPLFDTVPVNIQSPSILSGVGIFHKGFPGYAGFISLRVFGIKYTPYFDNFKSVFMNHGRIFRGYNFDESLIP